MKSKAGTNGKNGFSSLLNHKILSRKEELALVFDLNKGLNAWQAREKLFFVNLRLVESIAERYQKKCGLGLEDLRSEGMIGLINAIDKAEAGKMKKSRFASYAAWWIRQAIQKTIRKQGHIVDRPQRDFGKALKLGKNNGKDGQDDGITEEEKEVLVRLLKTPLSLNQLMRVNEEGNHGEDPAELIEALSDPRDGIEGLTIEADYQLKLKEALQELLQKRLSERERLVMVERCGLAGDDPKTLEEIAITLNLSKERVRQIEEKAKRELRKRAFLFEAKIS